MTKAKTVGAVERTTLYTTAQLHTSKFIEIIKGENAFIIDGIKGRLL